MTFKQGPKSALAELKALAKIIQGSIDTIEATLESKNMDFPSLSTPFTMESEAARNMPEVDSACSMIISAATQLVYTVRSPMASITTALLQYALTACLGLATSAHAAEACREAGPQGAHVNDIARASNIDPSKLARILRVLATNHIFVEVTPNAFANNRISSWLDTGKSVEAIIANPEKKHIGTLGVAAATGHCTDEAFKSAAYLQDVLFDPKLAFSQEPNETAMNAAFNTKLPMWEWFEQKGNEHRLLRFGITMEGAKNANPPTAILEGFDWKGLAQDSVVVDVGAGIGAQSLTLAQNYSHLRFAVQDREPVMKDAVGFWKDQLPGELDSGRVTLQAHDFFTPQPVKNAAVFLLRNILHDWSDRYCVQILRRLREAATPDTRLIIVDNLMSYACIEEGLVSIPGTKRNLFPKPLLPNGGQATAVKYYEDIQMMELVNGKERTVKEVQDLMKQAGWQLAQVHQSPVGTFSTQKAVGVPA